MISTDTTANVIHADAPPHDRSRGVLGSPRAVALGWLAAYLAASGALLVAGGRPGLALLHALLIALAIWCVRGLGARRAVGDLLPLFVAPLLYGEIPALIAALGSAYHDTLIQGLESAVFGGQPARAFVWMQGHMVDSLQDPAIQKVLMRGIAWAGKKPYGELTDYVPPQRAARAE